MLLVPADARGWEGLDFSPETTFEITESNTIRYWLKNENTPGLPPKTWRYAHFDSYATIASKKAVVVATLRKLGKMASHDYILVRSAVQKLHEFQRLQYPPALLRAACNNLAVTTRNTAWFRVREIISKAQLLPARQCPARSYGGR